MTKEMQVMDADWMVFHPNPRKPYFTPPPGAVDAHCHVFGPAHDFPYAAMRKYTPCDAGKEQLFSLRDHLGFSRNVIVQASCHGRNNDALVDALKTAGDLARGVAVVGPDVTDEELHKMDAAGVRGVRFNFVKRLVDATPKQVFLDIAARVKKL
ncbi:MAG: amidohydrolase family protein, partial [Amylibacter sp.]